MHINKSHSGRNEIGYQNRIMACVVAAEVIAIAFFNLWPVPQQGEKVYQDINFSDNVVAIEDVVVTRQESQPPPPPAPQVPIPVPNDRVIEEEIDLDEINDSEYTDSLSVTMKGSVGNSDKPMANPQRGPSVIRIVEPTVPEAAKEANVKAEIWVSFLVNEKGQVEEASISQIKLYDRDSGNVRSVQTIDYGLAEATINAALQWKFRPARNDGEIVRAYTRHIFTFGF